MSTARRGAGEGKTWDLSTPLAGYLRFHPRGIFVSDKTVALFFVDRGRAGGVRMATVQEESPGVWKKTSEAAVYPGDATALALGAHNDEICLLGSQRCDGGQELRLFISRDGAKSWKLRTKGEVSLEGDVCDIALIDNCSRAVGVIKTASAGGEPRHTIFVVELTSRAGGPRGSGGVPSQATP